MRGNLALSAQQPARAAPQQQQPQPHPSFVANRIIQRAPVPAAAAAAAAVPAAAAMSSSASSAALPAGYHRGTVKKFFDQADRLYGFIAVHEADAAQWNFGPDAYFKW